MLVRRGLWCALAVWLAVATTTAAQELVMAPVNPEFVRYQQERARQRQTTTEGQHLGLRPSPIDRSYLRQHVDSREFARDTVYPSSYDLRTVGGLTAIRNQGAFGTCWSFAAYGSLESTVLRTPESGGRVQGAAWDFSEKHMVNLAGFDPTPGSTLQDSGGNADMAAAYLARWGGAVTEASDPYPAGAWTASPAGLPVARHLQQVLWFSGKTTNPLNVDTIKYAVTTYGAVHTSMHWAAQFYTSATASYYYYAANPTNHAVAIVGWDDNYPKSNFTASVPSINGAFLVRNSWGSSWGSDGYFWVSYEDTWVGHELTVFNQGEPATNYETVYQYDPLGPTTNWGWDNNDYVAWGANIFTASASHDIRAVAFYANMPNTTYDLYIYTGVTAGQPRSGTLALTTSGSVPIAGYHTIPLPAAVPVTAQSRFSVVMRLRTPGSVSTMALERPYANYSSKATANAGESFYASNGVSWNDVGKDFASSICIKALAGGGTPPPPPVPGDFNGDGKADIVWRNRNTGDAIVWYMNGAAKAGHAGITPANADTAWRLAGIGDFNGDGKPDLFWRHATTGQNVIWFMNGAVRTSVAATITLSDADWTMAATGDVNGDGYDDLVWRHARTGENGVWYMNGATRLGAASMPAIADAAWRICGMGDFNGDGKPDLVWRHATTGEGYIALMNGAVQLATQSLTTVTDANWHIVQVGDFNGDGRADILWRNTSTGENLIWRMNGCTYVGYDRAPSVTDTTWDVNHPPLAPPAPLLTVPNDFNADGKADILWRNLTTGENVVWFMNGVARTGYSGLKTVAGAGYRAAAAVDFNADGKTDILWRNVSTGENTVWFMNGTAQTCYARMATVPPQWALGGAADFNADGKPDLLWRDPATGENIIRFMNGVVQTGYVRLATVTGSDWRVQGTADFTGDGKPDVLWRNVSTGENIVWQMNGTTRVANLRLTTVSDLWWSIVQASDFNGDGKTDILWRNGNTGENVVWYMNGTANTGNARLTTVPTAWRIGQ